MFCGIPHNFIVRMACPNRNSKWIPLECSPGSSPLC